MNSLPTTTRNQIVLGILSGMRSSAGLIGTSILIRQQAGAYFSPSPLVQFFNNDKTQAGLLLAGAAEIVVDKLPSTGNRIDAPMLTGRIISGALSGATIGTASGNKPSAGALVGGIAALASTFMFYYLRKTISKSSIVPDPFVGVAEDALTIAFGYFLIKSNKPTSPALSKRGI